MGKHDHRIAALAAEAAVLRAALGKLRPGLAVEVLKAWIRHSPTG
jgi:hypothetical protein